MPQIQVFIQLILHMIIIVMLQYSFLKRLSGSNLWVKPEKRFLSQKSQKCQKLLKFDKQEKKMSHNFSMDRKRSFKKNSIHRHFEDPNWNSVIINNNTIGKKGKQKSSSNFLKAKNLYKENKLEAAIMEFEKVLISQPEHEESLYLLGTSYLNQNRYKDAVILLEKLAQINPHYNMNINLLLAICHNKLKNIDKAIGFLTIALERNKDFYEAYCYRGKLNLAQKRFSKAEDDFQKAIEIDPQRQIAYCGKADCLRNRGLHKQSILFYTKGLQICYSSNILLKRVIIYYENEMYKEALLDIQEILEKEKQGSSEVYYYLGLLYLNYMKDQQKAIISFQQSIKANSNQKILTRSVQQLLKIKIKECDFYECTSILKWIKYYNVKNLTNWSLLIDAVVSMMKKKYMEAEEVFKQLQKRLEQKEQSYGYIFPLVKNFRAYGFFSLYRYEQAYHSLQEYERYVTTILGQDIVNDRIKYNKTFFESLMLCQCTCFEESIEKLDELLEKDPTNVQLLFYKVMVLFLTAFSDSPYIFDYESKEQILLSALDIIQETIGHADNPNLLFYDALLKGYFGLLSEAEKSISKGIQKAEENLAKFFWLRSIINSLNNNLSQAILDISVSLNIEEKAEYYNLRCRLYQMNRNTEQAYQDLQKFIEFENRPEELSKWAVVILFCNKSFEECQLALEKIPRNQTQKEIKEVIIYMNLWNGEFNLAGSQGLMIADVLKGEDTLGLDHLIANKQSFGYFSYAYLHFVRAIKYYILKQYALVMKDLRDLMFLLNDDEDLIEEVKYSLFVCHLLNGDKEKAKGIGKTKENKVNIRMDKILEAIDNNTEKNFGDLKQINSKKHLSEYLPLFVIPNTQVKIKISIPFPDFPEIMIGPKITDQLIQSLLQLQAVQGKACPPWIRKIQKTQAIQFTSHIESNDISLRTSMQQESVIDE